MSTSFRNFIERVRAASDLVDVIGADVELRSCGSVLKGLSPFHHEHHASFVVWPATQSWHDFSNGGGLGGDVFAYIQHRYGCDFKEALARQAVLVGVPNTFDGGTQLQLEVERRTIHELLTKAAAYYHRAVPNEIRREYYRDDYGFTNDTIDRFQLGWADGKLQTYFKNELGIDRDLALKTGLFAVTPGGKLRDFFDKRLVFPYWKHGRVVYFIGRRTKHTDDVEWEGAKYKKLATHSAKLAHISSVIKNEHFFGEDSVCGTDEIVITEGVTDCISATQAGIACVSPATTKFRSRDLPKLLALTRRVERVVVCNDAESSGAGTAGALETAAALHAEGRCVCIATLPRPDGVDKIDVNHFLKANSAESFHALLKQAPSYIEFLIAAIPPGTAKTKLTSHLQPVVSALSRCSAVELEGYIDLLAQRFKLQRTSIKTMLTDARKSEKTPRGTRDDKRVSVVSRIAEAPVGGDHVVPVGWILNDQGDRDTACLLRIVETKTGEVLHINVCSRPVVLTAWIRNLTTGNRMLEVAWKAGKWRTATVDRSKILDSAKIVDALAGCGFPVSSANRTDMVRYIADYEAANISAMAVHTVTEQMGWVKPGKVFLCGEQVITLARGQDTVEFRAADEGEAQLVASVAPAGNLEIWSEAIATIAEYPNAILGVYASLATPLLELLKQPGFAIDWSYRTSSGKTVVLRAAASVWGNPDERGGSSLIQTWNTTLVGFERNATALKNLPIILDDTKTAALPRFVAEILYQAAAGHGKTRGSVKGTRRVACWRTILLSTGERKATDFTKDAGSTVRCLTFWGNPFGGVSEDVAERIMELERMIFRNHGHAGPRFVEWLLAQDIETLTKRYNELHKSISAYLTDHFDAAVAARVGYAVAVVELAGQLAHEALPLSWTYKSPWETALSLTVEGLKDADRALEALQYFYDWAMARRNHFEGKRKNQRPPEEWAGRWKDDDFIAVTGRTLARVLEAGGFDLDPNVRQWAERGWLDFEGGRFNKTVRVCGTNGRHYVVNRVALELLAEAQ